MNIFFEPPGIKWSNGEILYSKVFLQKLSLEDGGMENITEKIERFTDNHGRLLYQEYGLYCVRVQCFNEAGGSPLSKIAILDVKYDPKSTWFKKDLNGKFLENFI